MTRYVVWEDSWYCGDGLADARSSEWVVVQHRLKATDCIKYQRANTARHILRPHIYETDEQALDDFLAIYWAWVEEVAD